MATLEEFATQELSKQGPLTPEKEQFAAQAVSQLRAQNPGKSDDEIISWVQGYQPGAAAPVATPPAEAPATPAPAAGDLTTPASTRADTYRTQTAEMKERFSPEKEQAARDESRRRNLGNELGQHLSVGLRVAGGDKNALDNYNKMNAEIANRPNEDFQAQKAAFQKQIEADLRAGDIEAADAKNLMSKFGLQWALKDRATAEAYAKAKTDPASPTSLAMRAKFKQMAPEMYAQIPNVDKMSAEQLSQYMPTVEKAYLEQLKTDGEKAKAQIGAQGKVDAAKVKADAAANKGPTVSNQIQGINTEIKVEKELGTAKSALIAAQSTKRDLAKAKEIIESNRLYSGPGTEVLNIIPTSFQDKDRAELLRIQKTATNQILMMAKGAQTEGDAARASRLTDLANGPATLETLKKMQTEIDEEENRLNGQITRFESLGSRTRQMTGGNPATPSAPSSGPKKISSQAEYDALPSGAMYIRPDGQPGKKK